jgi:acyl-coenzyme A thioesterase PaaI-like protein
LGHTNRTSKYVSLLNLLPGWLRRRLLTFAIGYIIKYMGTTGIKVQALDQSKAELTLKNRKIVQNHIGGIAAAAMVLMAEIASGLVISMNIPDSSLPVLQSMNFTFRKRARGAMRAVALLTSEQINYVQTTDKGSTTINVKMTDETGGTPVACEMKWAWTPKHRK